MRSDSPGKPLLIVLAGNTFPQISSTAGDFDDWIAAGLDNPPSQLRIDAREASTLPPPATLAGVVISGSHAMVTDRQPWSERLAAWLRTCVEARTPVLGICYGHQLLAHALGGRVGYRPGGLEIGTHDVTLTPAAAEDALFGTTPPAFPAQLVHAQAVLELPPGATLLASSAEEPCQAMRVGSRAWGVQFHPEFSAEAMRGYIRCKAEALIAQRRDPSALLTAVRETPEAANLLRRFAAEVARA